MSHTYSNLLSHVVFSTKDRRPLIDAELKPRLLRYINGIVDESGGKVLSLNAMPDHLHMLWELPPANSLSDSMRVLKTNSSRWVHETWGPGNLSPGRPVMRRSASAGRMSQRSQTMSKGRSLIIANELFRKNSLDSWSSMALTVIRDMSSADVTPRPGFYSFAYPRTHGLRHGLQIFCRSAA